jgi:hypothetical protein
MHFRGVNVRAITPFVSPPAAQLTQAMLQLCVCLHFHLSILCWLKIYLFYSGKIKGFQECNASITQGVNVIKGKLEDF